MLNLQKEKCSKACDNAYEVGHKARELLNTATNEIEATKANVTDYIRREPVRAGAIIAGIAYLLGKLNRRH